MVVDNYDCLLLLYFSLSICGVIFIRLVIPNRQSPFSSFTSEVKMHRIVSRLGSLVRFDEDGRGNFGDFEQRAHFLEACGERLHTGREDLCDWCIWDG